MAEITKDITKELKDALRNASEVWTAVAMMNGGGLQYFESLPEEVVQHHLIGIDLPTPTTTLERLRDLCSDTFSAKVKETNNKYYFHPKTYIIKDHSGNYTAFVGSSNATNGGFRNNIELNVKITDEESCKELIKWYWQIDRDAILITQELIDEHRRRYNKIKKHQDDQDKEKESIKSAIHRSDGQFFSTEHHEVFKKEYQKKRSKEIQNVRGKVRKRFMELHKRINPKFGDYGLIDLHGTVRGQDQTSRHYPSRFSGLTIRSVWLHYGKSPSQLSRYPSDNKENSFINHVRMQVIIHENDVGIWLVLGKDGGSKADRKEFRKRMTDPVLKKRFLDALKKLDGYWIRGTEGFQAKNIKKLKDIDEVLKAEHTWEYFIIGKDYDPLHKEISDENIESTVLDEFKKLFPIYALMNAEIV